MVNSAGRLLGIISRVDVLAVFSRTDDEIEAEVVHRVLPDVLPVLPRDLTVTVADGIVTIWGRPESDQDRRTILDAVRHVQGVVAVRDRLT